MSTANAIKLYAAATPNGIKIPILLELLGLKYDYQKINFSTNEQKEDWYLKLNPNGRIPTLVDSSTGVTIGQTAAILQYLTDTYDKDHKFSYKFGTKEYYKQLEYLIFSVAEQGPITGQLGHFTFAAPEKIPYAINRYSTDVKRILGVFELILSRNKEGLFLVGNHISIVDISVLGWANNLARVNIDVNEFSLFSKWLESIKAIPEVQKGLTALN
ncbi:glutathione S-transferase [Scheffersomyces xylosifermentans]|uniref:glutathione S-transferase n=1 Tax=Scheffersomyces xylosifermentans TaxID=1304137 RepID=UPI00315DAB44